ncbi:DUF3526 domain-containing protein [Rhizorhabdus sp. FW153]|uniref:DUF3526 domain-containing protein n=1 Tax=Rhizorhabdus sp. FW153 TaxID=3400216 RepID=UPI003CF64286
MIGALVRLDARLMCRSTAACILTLLLAVTAGLALASGLEWRDRYVSAADAAREQVAKDATLLRDVYTGIERGTVIPTDDSTYDGVGKYVPDPRDPYVAGYYHTLLAELEAGPLLGLATGSSELRATHHKLKTVPLYALLRIGEPAERVNPGALAAGRFDLLAFIMFLCPLALAVLLFDATAREREGGISPLLAGLGASQRELLLARAVTRGGLVIGIAVIGSLIGIALAGAFGSAAGFWWILGTIAYLLFWTALLLLVASTGLSVVGSAAVAVALWVALLLVLPGLTERALRPDGLLEPRALADADVRRVLRVEGGPDAIAATIARVAREYWGVDFATAPICAKRDGVIDEYVRRRLADERYAAAMRQGAAREALFDQRLDRWGWLAPGLAFRRAMEQVAGSDPARQRTFELAVIDYHAARRNQVTSAILECKRLDRAAFEAVRSFHFDEPTEQIALFTGIIALIGFAALFAAAALRPRSLLR